MKDFSANSCLKAKIDIALYGTNEEPILVITITNNSIKPIKLDRELVFLVTINIIGANETSLEFEEIKSLPMPEKEIIKNRFILLKPDQSIQRKLELKRSFKYFVYGIGASDTQFKITAYEALCRLPEQSNPHSINVSYAPLYAFREGFKRYTGIESTTFGLFEGPLQTSVEWKFNGKKN